MAITPNALYQTLLEDIGEGPDDIWPGASMKDAARCLMRRGFLRKLELKSEMAESRALLKFLQINKDCEDWELVLQHSGDELLWGEFKSSLDNFFHPKGELLSDWGDIFHSGRTGPGTSIEANGGDFYTKLFSSPLSTTSTGLYRLYLQYTRTMNLWKNGELLRSHKFGGPVVVEGNRLSFVPKYRDISRVICIEPSLNMFCQLGLGAAIERRLEERFAISLSDQPLKNRELARRGSLFDDSFTIDLESASDSMSLNMLQMALPGDIYDLLLELRSPFCQTPIGKRELHMVSTMGNGFTFPLQTALFSCVIEACARVYNVALEPPRGKHQGNWGVFGDDIIAPTSLWEPVNRLLSILGFRVNASKSFRQGPFRESCGGDYYRGVNVRAVYVKRMGTKQERYAIINRLNRWSTTTGILLRKTMGLLLSSVPWNPVPRYEDMSAGIQVPFSLLCKKSKVWHKPDDPGVILYRPWVAAEHKISIGDRVFNRPAKERDRWYNPPGLLLALVGGFIRGGKIGVRYPDQTIYERRTRVTLYWDHVVEEAAKAAYFRWCRWETTVCANCN
jgi:hypothetical protein